MYEDITDKLLIGSIRVWLSSNRFYPYPRWALVHSKFKNILEYIVEGVEEGRIKEDRALDMLDELL